MGLARPISAKRRLAYLSAGRKVTLFSTDLEFFSRREWAPCLIAQPHPHDASHGFFSNLIMHCRPGLLSLRVAGPNNRLEWDYLRGRGGEIVNRMIPSVAQRAQFITLWPRAPFR